MKYLLPTELNDRFIAILFYFVLVMMMVCGVVFVVNVGAIGCSRIYRAVLSWKNKKRKG